ncbi:MAG: NlpC/P60 family protein [Gemmatimonadales bacterium]
MPHPSAVIARAGVVPVLREASLRSEQVTQLVLGETGRVLEVSGDWRRLRIDGDNYEGWAHLGYLIETTASEAEAWRARAGGWSDGAVVQVGRTLARLPLRARVELTGDAVVLPDGRRGRVLAGRVLSHLESVRSARRQPPARWAINLFAGAPYQWGGVTPWGVDCSGLVQTTFAARGAALPRDASQQADLGSPVSPDTVRPGDLLFFGEGDDRVTHVALAGDDDTLVHSTLSCGGVVQEPWAPGTRAAPLRARLLAVRRLEG